jgi:hypothetical protein
LADAGAGRPRRPAVEPGVAPCATSSSSFTVLWRRTGFGVFAVACCRPPRRAAPVAAHQFCSPRPGGARPVRRHNFAAHCSALLPPSCTVPCAGMPFASAPVMLGTFRWEARRRPARRRCPAHGRALLVRPLHAEGAPGGGARKCEQRRPAGGGRSPGRCMDAPYGLRTGKRPVPISQAVYVVYFERWVWGQCPGGWLTSCFPGPHTPKSPPRATSYWGPGEGEGLERLQACSRPARKGRALPWLSYARAAAGSANECGPLPHSSECGPVCTHGLEMRRQPCDAASPLWVARMCWSAVPKEGQVQGWTGRRNPYDAFLINVLMKPHNIAPV